MHKLYITYIFVISLLSLTSLNTANADDVKIIAADFRSSGDHSWSVSVTLNHDDAGWDHYADNWRVVDSEGHVLGDRVLYHPHVDEQPFTRNLSGVTIPENVSTVYIEAHDKVHGWSPNKLKVDLNKAINGHLKVSME